MSRYLFIIIYFFLSAEVFAGGLQIGIHAGPSMLRNADFNGGNTSFNTHLMAGLDISYPLTCHSRFCDGLFLEPRFSLTLPATTHFGSTTVAGTGLTGNYSESLRVYTGDLNFKKHFTLKSKLTLFAIAGAGISYFKLSNTRFTDALGVALPLTISETSLNINVNLGFGFAYELSDKLLLDLGIIPHLVMPSVTDQSYITFPVGIHYAF